MLDDVLLPAIVHALQDHTSVAKQEAAVKALGQVGATVSGWAGLVCFLFLFLSLPFLSF